MLISTSSDTPNLLPALIFLYSTNKFAHATPIEIALLSKAQQRYHDRHPSPSAQRGRPPSEVCFNLFVRPFRPSVGCGESGKHGTITTRPVALCLLGHGGDVFPFYGLGTVEKHGQKNKLLLYALSRIRRVSKADPSSGLQLIKPPSSSQSPSHKRSLLPPPMPSMGVPGQGSSVQTTREEEMRASRKN